jgi:hypothetical protein
MVKIPYKIVPVAGGEKVQNTATGKMASTRPLPHAVAVKQFRLLSGLENGWQPTGEPSAMTPRDKPSPSTEDKARGSG